jgi:hypothetical protein
VNPIFTLSNNYRRDLLRGAHNFDVGGSVFKVALYGVGATINASTSGYTASGELVDPSYVAGGLVISQTGPVIYGERSGSASFSPVTFSGLNSTVGYVLFYNDTYSGKPTLGYVDFGATGYTLSGGDLVISLPSSSSPNPPILIQ